MHLQALDKDGLLRGPHVRHGHSGPPCCSLRILIAILAWAHARPPHLQLGRAHHGWVDGCVSGAVELPQMDLKRTSNLWGGWATCRKPSRGWSASVICLWPGGCVHRRVSAGAWDSTGNIASLFIHICHHPNVQNVHFSSECPMTSFVLKKIHHSFTYPKQI